MCGGYTPDLVVPFLACRGTDQGGKRFCFNIANLLLLQHTYEDDTVWLNRHQIALLFGRDIKTIGKHINNVFSEGELEKEVVVANFATTTQHGAIKGKTQTLNVEYYNLDVIISVGYRVKSKQGTQFRIWANKVLKDYLLKGYVLNQRMNRIESTVENLSEKVKAIDLQINSNTIPTQGIFFEGQVLDAYELASRIIRTATKSVVLIDNYIDETSLIHLSKKKKGVSVLLLTKNKNNEKIGHYGQTLLSDEIFITGS